MEEKYKKKDEKPFVERRDGLILIYLYSIYPRFEKGFRLNSVWVW